MPKKQLRQPEYWMDFEDLCKRLWTEVWNYSETKKNGRNGQTQNGVDIYGRQNGEGGLIGIQCKGKDEYTHAQLTKQEIDIEIEKAKLFQPRLAKLYFATTSTRSSNIAEYLRQIDEEHRLQNLFEVHVYFWDDIVELIDQHKSTHDWYLNKIGFQNSYNAELQFDNQQNEIELRPIFILDHTNYMDSKVLKIIDYEKGIRELKSHAGIDLYGLKQINSLEEYIEFLNTDLPQQSSEEFNDPQPIEFNLNHFAQSCKKINNSVCIINLQLKNTGSEVLDDFKVYLNFENIVAADTINKQNTFLDTHKYSYNVLFTSPSKKITAEFSPTQSVLVQDDQIHLDGICIKTFSNPDIGLINWKLVSRGFSKNGQLKLLINPKIEEVFQVKFVDDPSQYTPYKKIRNKYQY